VLPSKEDASIYLGWTQEMNASLIHAAISDGTLARYMREYKVQAGDVAPIPAGTVHAMRRNTIVAEIQENSDITYRLYDYNRIGNDGKMRPLKLDKALEVMDYAPNPAAVVTHPQPNDGGIANIAKTPYFTANVMQIDRAVQRDYAPLDSFVAYMCVEGNAVITALDSESEDRSVDIRLGEAVLIPATLNDIVLKPAGSCKLLEIYMEMQ